MEDLMFKRPKKKKSFPPGTFIPTPARIMAIIQLSLAFTLFLWNVSLPFMGETFTYKNDRNLYHTVMGKSDGIESAELKEKVTRNAKRFDTLPQREKLLVLDGYQKLLESSQTSFLEKLKRSVTIALVGIPTFEMAWLCLAVIIPIMLLLKVPSAREAVWLLPLVTAVYIGDQALFSTHRGNDDNLYPSEKIIVEQYLKEPLSPNIFAQQQQLKKGWHLYLVQKWAKTHPSNDETLFLQQVEEGEFAFYLARLQRLKRESAATSLSNAPKSSPVLLGFLVWNFAFAVVVSRYANRSPATKLCTS